MKLNIFTVAVILLAGSSSPLFAQEDGKSKPPVAAPSALQKRLTEGSVNADFNFNGGNIREFLDQLGEVFKESFQEKVDLEPEVRDQVRVPKFSLRNATYPMAFETLNGLAVRGVQGLGQWVQVGDPRNPSSIVYVPSKESEPARMQVRAFRRADEKLEREFLAN